MRERGWRLAYPGTAYEFGGVDPVTDKFQRNLGRCFVQAYDVSEAAVTPEDNQRPRTDGVRMGQDYLGGVTHTFTLAVRGRTPGEAERLLGEASRAWRADAIRKTPLAVAELTTRRGGREWTMLGRPRRFKPNLDRLQSGEATATATFETIDDLWYGPVQSIRVDLRSVPVGGFTFPVSWPLVMGPPTVRAGQMTVGGTMPAPVELELHGPITNPTVNLANAWRFKLETSLGAGRVVTADPRVGSVTDQDGASYGGTLPRGVRLDDLVLQPAMTQQLTFAGTDPTGSAYLVARWRDVSTSRG